MHCITRSWAHQTRSNYKHVVNQLHNWSHIILIIIHSYLIILKVPCWITSLGTIWSSTFTSTVILLSAISKSLAWVCIRTFSPKNGTTPAFTTLAKCFTAIVTATLNFRCHSSTITACIKSLSTSSCAIYMVKFFQKWIIIL